MNNKPISWPGNGPISSPDLTEVIESDSHCFYDDQSTITLPSDLSTADYLLTVGDIDYPFSTDSLESDLSALSAVVSGSTITIPALVTEAVVVYHDATPDLDESELSGQDLPVSVESERVWAIVTPGAQTAYQNDTGAAVGAPLFPRECNGGTTSSECCDETNAIDGVAIEW